MSLIRATVDALRSQVGQLNLPSTVKPQVFIKVADAPSKQVMSENTHILGAFIKSESIKIMDKAEADPAGTVKNFISEQVQTLIKVVGLIDINLEVRINHS